MAISYAALAAEIENDPQTYGYAALVTAGNDQGVADLLNAVRTGADGEAAIVVRRADISSKELWEAIVVADMTALPTNPTAAQLSSERRQLAWLSGLPAIDRLRLQNDNGSDAPPVTNLLAIFPAGSGTRSRLQALATRNGSRAEQLFGADTTVDSLDVARALGRG